MKTFLISLLLGALRLVGLNTGYASPALGAYANPLVSTLANYVSGNASVQQQLWIDRVLDTNGASIQSTPFADGMIGRATAGKPASNSQLQKAVVEITDTSKVRGDTINIYSEAGIGGEGATGDNARLGTEAQIVTGNMTVQIGNQLFAVGYKQSAVDKSMIGKSITQNSRLNDALRALHNKRKNDTIIWRMMAAAQGSALGFGNANFVGTAGANPNILYPQGVSGRSALRSTHTVDRPLIVYAGDYLPGLGAMPMDTTQDSGGSVGELFMFLSPDKALMDLESDPTNLQLMQYGADRGKDVNPVFQGGFTKFGGHGLYRWIHRDHANFDNIGSPLLPRAKLSGRGPAGGAGSAASLSSAFVATDVIYGGGTLTGADSGTTAQWFKHFSNAPVVMYGGIGNIAPTSTQVRWLMIIGSGGYSQFSFTVNDGNKITVASQVTSTCTAGGGTNYKHSAGDLIVECSLAGQTFGRSLMFGAQAVVGGIGSINGSSADPQSGRMVKQVNDLENDISIGVEGCAGYSAVKRAGDGAYPGFVVIEHAVTVPGAPTV